MINELRGSMYAQIPALSVSQADKTLLRPSREILFGCMTRFSLSVYLFVE